jgi:hypothetical protein
MNPLLFLGLTLSASAVAHYSVVFLEPHKASVLKAMALNILVVALSNIARWTDLSFQPAAEWLVYVVVTAACVQGLYKLKSHNCLTVGTCYVAGSFVLAQAMAV